MEIQPLVKHHAKREGDLSASTTADRELPADVFARLNTTFATGVTHDISFRLDRLRELRAWVVANEDAFCDAMWFDLRRNKGDTFAIEYSSVLSEIDYFLANLRKLAVPEQTARMLLTGCHAEITYTPKGVVLVYGPSNFPLMLSLRPVMAAIAAGNCVVIKPSEFTPAAERLLTTLPGTVESNMIAVITGGSDMSAKLMQFRWDHVMFTGSTPVGRKVMAAAAPHLIPVTLELGGKNPCIVAADADIPTAAVSIVGGKNMNAGQICLAPDYCLVDESIISRFCDEVVTHISEKYGPDPKISPHFTHISARHVDRLRRCVEQTRGEVILGGKISEPVELGDKDMSAAFEDMKDVVAYMEPTVIRFPSGWETDPKLVDDIVMQDELFGPVLVILPVPSVSVAIDIARSKPVPLSLYVFTKDDALARTVLQAVRSGNAAVNETIFQVTFAEIVAGVGESGLGGGYGKKAGFYTLSHPRGVFYCNPTTSKILRSSGTNLSRSSPQRRMLTLAFAAVDITPRPVKGALKVLRWIGCPLFAVTKAFVITRFVELAAKQNWNPLHF